MGICDSSSRTQTFRSGVESDWRVAGHSRESGRWFFKERSVDNRNEGTKSSEVRVKARRDFVEFSNLPNGVR